MSVDTVLELFRAFHRTAAVKAAIELDLFTAIGAGVTDAGALATRCGAAARGIRILCDYLTAVGLLRKHGDRYALDPDAAAFLDRRSPAYLGCMVTSVAGETNLHAFSLLTAAVRRGGTALPQDGVLRHEHPGWVEFARAMIPAGAFMGPRLAGLLEVSASGRIRVLDVAAGHGLFGIAIASQNPQAQVVALDWPGVLAVANENAAAAGVADRYRVIPGDVFTAAFGEGYDLVLLTNFLPDLDPAGCERLLAKVHAALVPGGRAVALQFFADDDRTSPAAAADLSLALLATTPGGDVYTVAELDRMFRKVGFPRTELHELQPERVVIAYR